MNIKSPKALIKQNKGSIGISAAGNVFNNWVSLRLRLFFCNLGQDKKGSSSTANKPGRIRDSIKVSFWEGVAASAMGGLMQNYAIPYALALKATTMHIGLLGSIPNLFASVVGLKSPDFTDRGSSRRSLILISAFLHGLMLLPIILIPYFITSHQVNLLILFTTLFVGFNMLGQGAFVSLLNDYISANKRGTFFGWRSKVFGLVSVLFGFLAGIIMQAFKHDIIYGIGITLTLAMLFRFISWYCLTKMYEPKYHSYQDSYFSFIDFLRKAKESNFAKFVFFVSGMNLSINIAAPFFGLYMLKELRFGYLLYVTVNTVNCIVMLIFSARWGRLADKIGNIKVLKFTSYFVITFPFFWIICRNPFYIFSLQVAAGFIYAGFNLAASNFIFDSTTPAKRIRCFSYFNVINGLSVSIGAALGGYLAPLCPELLGSKLLFIFMLSGIVRLIIVLVFSRQIKEVRGVSTIKVKDMFKSLLWR